MGHLPPSPPAELSRRERWVVLLVTFLGWLGAGAEMGLGPLASRPALVDLLSRAAGGVAPAESEVGAWFAWLLCAFLLGGALGGAAFGSLGDRAGRVQALGWSVLCYAGFTGVSYLAQSPQQLLVLRFLASLGIGGMWPAGVALASEAWPDASRPTIAGVMGAAANVGILLMALAGQSLRITPDSWRWAMLLGATPALLGLYVLARVPESPRWRAQRQARAGDPTPVPLSEVFRPPLLQRTLLGIILGTVPLLGAWSSGKWLIPWAQASGTDGATAQALWAFGAVIGGAVGGWVTDWLGRRLTYFLVSLVTLLINLTIYRELTPRHAAFLPAVFVLGMVATVFFGWLPLCLPELFPTRVRATGSGVSFNTGRVVSAAGVLAAGQLMTAFDGSYARVGEVTSWVYAVGLVLILFAPDTGKDTLRD